MLVMTALVAVGAVTNRQVQRSTAVQTSRATHQATHDSASSPTVNGSNAVRLSSYHGTERIGAAIRDLRARRLSLPIPNIATGDLRDSFYDARSDGSRRHLAIDIPAPRGTPVLSADNGIVLELKTTRLGGISLFAADGSEQFIFFYAHLTAYHPRMHEGLRLQRGDTIGFVGTTGNAQPDTPHLHFAILISSSLARWSSGTPVNPAEIWR